MLAMHRDGVITLPPPRGRQGRPKPIVFGPDTEPPLFPAPKTLDEVRPLDMRIVFENMRGYVPTALVGLTLDDAEFLCDRLNARLGLTRKDWTAIVARSMGAGSEPGRGLH